MTSQEMRWEMGDEEYEERLADYRRFRGDYE
jgi:hypothetical protein